MEDHWIIMKPKFTGGTSYIYGPFTEDDAKKELINRVSMYGDGSSDDEFYTIKMVKDV